MGELLFQHDSNRLRAAEGNREHTSVIVKIEIYHDF